MLAVADVSYEVERVRVFCIALSLVGDPWIVFLDEPTTGPDPKSRFRFQSRSCLRRQYARGMAIMTTTHYLEEAREYCDADVLDLTRRFAAHYFRIGSLWKNSIALVEVRRTSDGGNGDLLPVVTQFGGVRLRTGYDV